MKARAFYILSALILLAACGSRTALAQDVRVQATVNATTIGTEERVIYTLEVEGANLSDVRVPEAPAADNLVLEQSIPSTSRNVSIINGQMSQSVSYRWSYRPRGEGTARIAATTVQVGDRRLTTEPIRITVVSQSQRPQQPPTAAQPPGWPFGGRRQAAPQQPQTISSDDLFIRAIPNKRRAYTNEQVIIEYQLYGRDYIQLRQSRLTDSWDAEGFWREELEVDTRPVPRSVVENGLRYNVITLKRVAVFPTRAGTLRVDPLQIETEVYVPGRSSDPFSAFFPGTSFQPVNVSSPAVTIDVQALPAGAPPEFAGAVGDFRLQASMDRTTVDVGESVQVQLRLTGSGNLATLAPPAFQAPGLFEQYDPQIETVIDRSGTAIRGTKSITHVLVPRSNGSVEMPEIVFAYFEPSSGQYRRLSARPGTLRVTGTADPAALSATSAGMPVDDIAGIKTGEAEWRRLGDRPLHTNPLPYVAVVFPVLAVAGVVAFRRRTDRLATDVRYARGKRAHPLAKKHLREAEALLQRSE
ncbi:MAG TPA: BatD family protein, partial [Rhodothermales bacterium]